MQSAKLNHVLRDFILPQENISLFLPSEKSALHEKKRLCQSDSQLILGPNTFTLRLRTPRKTVLYQQGEG